MSRALSRSASNSGSRAAASARRGDEIAGMNERALQPRVAERLVRILLESRRRRGRRSSLVSSALRRSPAYRSCRRAPRRHGAPSPCRPWRCSLPAMFIRQPRSPASSVSAPLRLDLAAFSLTIASESSPYLTAKVPPKPQQISLSSSSTSLRPSTLASNWRGWFLTPSSRKPEQES